MTTQERLLTTIEAAEILQLSKAHLDKLRLVGGGPRFVRLGRAVRYRAADLQAWVEANIVASTSEAAR